MADKKITVFVEASVGGAKRKLKQVNTAMSSMANVAKIALGAVAVQYGRMAAASAVNMARVAAKNLDLEKSYESLSARYNLASDEILEALDRAAKGTVDKYTLMLAANKAMRLGVATNTEEFEQLMKIAAVRAKEFGFTTAQAFDFIVTAIGRASPMIADNIGILLDANTTYKEYADSIGKSADELTMLEQKEAIRNRILREGLPDMKTWNEMGETASDVFQQYDSVMVELRQELGERFLPVVVGVTKELSKFLTGAETAEEKAEALTREIIASSGSFEEARRRLIELNLEQRRGGRWAAEATKDWRGLITVMGDWEPILGALDRGIREDVVAMRLGHRALGDLSAATDSGADAQAELQEKVESSTTAWLNYYDAVSSENLSFTRRMADLDFRQTQAFENAAFQRSEIERRAAENRQDILSSHDRRYEYDLESHLSRIRFSFEDHYDKLADMEFDYQEKIQQTLDRAPWWIRQALQKEFTERERIAKTGDKKALREYDKALRERIRLVDPIYAKELDKLEAQYEHEREIEEREQEKGVERERETWDLRLREQDDGLREQLRRLDRELENQRNAWNFSNQQRLENERRSLATLQQTHREAMDNLATDLNRKLAEINGTFEQWGRTHGDSYARALAQALNAVIAPGFDFGALVGPQPFPTAPFAFQQGAWEVPRDMMGMVHRGEMIVPAPAAERIREGEGAVSIHVENLVIGPGVTPMTADAFVRDTAEELGRLTRERRA